MLHSLCALHIAFQISCFHAKGHAKVKDSLYAITSGFVLRVPLFLPHLVYFNSFSQHSWTRSWAHGIDHKGQNITLLCWWMQPCSTWAHKTPRAWFGAQHCKCLIITAQISHIRNKRQLLHKDTSDSTATLYYIVVYFLFCGLRYCLLMTCVLVTLWFPPTSEKIAYWWTIPVYTPVWTHHEADQMMRCWHDAPAIWQQWIQLHLMHVGAVVGDSEGWLCSCWRWCPHYTGEFSGSLALI